MLWKFLTHVQTSTQPLISFSMKNEQLLKKVIETIADNSDAYILASLSNGQVSLSMLGKDAELSNMIEGIGASYINSVLEDTNESVADAIQDLLDELGLGEDDAESN